MNSTERVNSGAVPRICCRGTVSNDNKYTGQDMKPRPSKYTTAVYPALQRCVVCLLLNTVAAGNNDIALSDTSHITLHVL
jgi:hypothetical protein